MTRYNVGDPIPQKASTETLELLLSRRSAPAQTLGLPAPSPNEMDQIITAGLRVPDHGKLTPWRIVRFSPESRAQLLQKLDILAKNQADQGKAEAGLKRLSIPPEMVMVISSPVIPAHGPPKKPVWEQQLSSACVCYNMVLAAVALGYNAHWITEWVSYDPEACALLGLKGGEQISGIIMLGTATETPIERERPDLNQKVSWWKSQEY